MQSSLRMQLQRPIRLQMQTLGPILSQQHEIHILRICHTRKLFRQGVQIPHLDHGLVRARSHGEITIRSRLDLDRGLREREPLDQLELTEGMLRSLSFLACRFLGSDFGGEPCWEG